MSAKCSRRAAEPPHYFVSATHVIWVGSGAESTREPFGIQHAREGNSPLTACGEWAVEWRLFWDLPFPASPTNSCRKCMRVVSEVRQEHGERRESHLV